MELATTHFKNLATAATKGNDIIQWNLNQLTKSSDNQHNKIEILITELKSALPLTGGRIISVGGGSVGGNSSGRNTISATKK